MRAVEHHADAKILKGYAIVALTAGAVNWHFPLVSVGETERKGFGSWGCGDRLGRGLRRYGWGSLGSRSRNGRSFARGWCGNRDCGPFLKARRKFAAKSGFGVQLLGAGDQHRFAFNDLRVRHTAVHRAHRGTRLMVVKPHALSAFFRDDVEDAVGDCGMFDAVQ